MKTASRGKVEWDGRTVGNRCNVHRFRVVLNERNCEVRTKIPLTLSLSPFELLKKPQLTYFCFPRSSRNSI